MKNKKEFLLIGFLFLLLFITTGCSGNKQTTDNSTQTKEVKKIMPEIKPVAYEIIKTEDQSHKATGEKSLSDYTMVELAELPIDKKMLYRIVVSSEIKENQVKPTIDKIISQIIEDDNEIDEISLLIYSNKDLIDSSYDVAMATWAPFGELGKVNADIAKNNSRDLYKTSFRIKDNLEEYLIQKNISEDKFGLTEEERKLIYKELSEAEKRAINEAEKVFPINITDPKYKQENITKNLDLQENLLDKYNSEIFKKHLINEDQKIKIIVEAMTENW